MTMPAIILPNYTDIAKKKNNEKKDPVTITEEEIEKSLEWLKKTREQKEAIAEQETKDAKKEEKTEPNSANEASPSAQASEDKNETTYDDEFAKSVGNFKTLEELRTTIETNLKLEKEQKARDAYKMSLLDGIIEKSEMDLPELLIASEQQKMLQELQINIGQMGMPWEEYLKHIKKSEEDLQKEWRPDAERRVKAALVLKEIGKQEALDPTEEETMKWAEMYVERQPEEVQKQINPIRVKEYAYGVLRNEKVFAFLESIGVPSNPSETTDSAV